MAFVPEPVIEARAADLWRRLGLTIGFDAEALLDRLDLGLLWEHLPEGHGERILGALVAGERCVLLNEAHLDELEANLGLRRFTIGHEVGHWVLHAGAIKAGTIPLMDDSRTWCRSGASDNVERQAEMFAARLLAPTELLRAALPAAGWAGWAPVYRLAETFGVTPTAMSVRLEELGWAHRDGADVPRSGRRPAPGQGVLFSD